MNSQRLATLRDLISLVVSIVLLVSRNVVASDSPNVVVILADDMGYGDVQALNPGSKIPTPNLNGLAESGMMFTDAHTPSAVCTPTRYGLLTGRYCWRSRLKRGVQNGYGPPLIEKNRPTMASFLKAQGYQTGIVGKWHLGLGFQRPDGRAIDFAKPLDHGPNDLGFGWSRIIPASLDFPPYVYIENHRVTGLPNRTQEKQSFPQFLRKGELGSDFDMEGCLDHLAEQASGFIAEASKQDAPFFLYFPLTAPHKPVWPAKRFQGTTKLGSYGDFVAQVDWTVGSVLKAIDGAGVRDNTIVIYTSDNGSFMYRLDESDAKGHVDDDSVQGFRSDRHRANGPLRGTKADIWEAGHRVPFFVRWPGKVRKGSRSATTVCLTDVFATLADVVAKPKPTNAAPDSFSFLPDLHGKKRETERPIVIHHSSGGMFSGRLGDWKLVLGNGSGGRQQPKGKPFARPYQLFNLANDLGESEDVLSQNPQVAKELEAAVQAITKDHPI
jgi:arylsulfatase A-like enzyme